VSLCLIVKNEQDNLTSCLRSAVDLVHEIIVVDTGSTDRTKDVATSLGARVFDFTWVDSFAAARNESLRHATGDWIFWLDGDEYLDEANRQKARALFASLGCENVAYSMKQCSAPEAAGGSATVVDQVRLFRNLPQVRWEHRVHEQILPAVRRTGHEVRFTDIAITHTGYEDPALRGQKTLRNLRLLELEFAEQPDHPFTLFNLGWAYQDLGRIAEALPLLRRSLARSQRGDSIIRKAYTLLVQGYRQLGKAREALAACRAGRAHCPDDAELLFLEGLLRREQGDLARAEACFRELLDLRPGAHFASLDAGLRGHKARHHLALVCREQGRVAEAESEWRAALAEQPDFLPASLELGELYLGQGRWAELEEVAGRLEALRPGGVEPAVVRARGHFARREFTPARRLLEETIERHPAAVGPQVFLSYVLLQEGQDWEAAERTLCRVLELDEGNAEAQRNLDVLLRQQRRAPTPSTPSTPSFPRSAWERRPRRSAARVAAADSAAPPDPSATQSVVAGVPTRSVGTRGSRGRSRGDGPMRIAFACFSPFPFLVDSAYESPLGGSESAVCYLAEALAAQGHDVFLLNASTMPALSRGVNCLPLTDAAVREILPLDALVVLTLAGKGQAFRALVGPETSLVLWIHLPHDQPAIQALQDPAEREAYDGFALVSDWQRGHFLRRFGLDSQRTAVLRNAVAPAFLDLFKADELILAHKPSPPVLAYTSVPYRGLDLLLDALPHIRRGLPGTTLRVYSSMQVYRVAQAEDQSRYGRLYERCRYMEGVEYLGSLPQPELARALKSVSALAYPNTFPETACIAVLEALAAGCRVVTSDLGGIPETAAGFARLIPAEGGRDKYLGRFVEETVRVLSTLAEPDRAEVADHLRRQVGHVNQSCTWALRAEEWARWLSRAPARVPAGQPA
jgi:tetratricopeptide (TPR) repeat protein/glycosyltransferase involved in cell wall biosynthesis